MTALLNNKIQLAVVGALPVTQPVISQAQYNTNLMTYATNHNLPAIFGENGRAGQVALQAGEVADRALLNTQNIQNQLSNINVNMVVLGGAVGLTAIAVGYLFYSAMNQDAKIVDLENKYSSFKGVFSSLDQRIAGLEADKGSLILCQEAHKNCSDKNQQLLNQSQNALNMTQEYEAGWQECLRDLVACENTTTTN